MIGMLYWHYYLLGIIILPGIIFGLVAQAKVSNTYAKYSKVVAKCGKSSSEIARLLLDTANLQSIKLTKADGELGDYYDPTKKIIALSKPNGNSVADISVAAHEIGHALQYKTNYLPIKLRTAAIKLSNISSALLMPLILIALISNFWLFPTSTFGTILLWISVGTFGLSTLVGLVTLPVEYNASSRATKILEDSKILDKEETVYAKKMLNAAALTYVASLFVSLLSLLRILLIVFSLNSNRD